MHFIYPLQLNDHPAVPFPFWYTAFTLKNLHNLWQRTVRFQAYTNPDHLLGLSVGYALNFALGERRLLKLPALPFLVGSRLLDLFEQEEIFQSSCLNWKEAFYAIQPITFTEQLKQLSQSQTGSFRITWTLKIKRRYIRIQLIAYATLSISKESFKLVMRLMDFIEIFRVNRPQFQQLVDLSVQEAALTIPRCLRALNQNRHALSARLKVNTSNIDWVLKRSGAKKWNGETFITLANNGIDQLMALVNRYENAAVTMSRWITGEQKKPLLFPPQDLITAKGNA